MKARTTTLLLTIFAFSALSAKETIIFDGHTDGWKMAGPGKFNIKDKVATATGGMGLWWYSKKELRNFSLRLQFKIDEVDDNSGIFVRFPDPKNDPWIAVRQGYEIQVAGDQLGKQSTGSIFDIQAATHIPLNVGEWNDYHIIGAGNKIAVVLNGEVTNIFTCQPGRGDEKGYIGIQNHDDNSPAHYRNISIEEWPDNTSMNEAFALAGVPRSSIIQYQAKLDKDAEWYDHADHGPAFAQTYGDWFDGKYRPNSALKGILLSYSTNKKEVALFNTETLSLMSATQDGVNLINTPWGGGHGKQNEFLNEKSFLFNTLEGSGWADSEGAFLNNRPHVEHGNFDHLKFHGYQRHGNQIILQYSVNDTAILDSVKSHKNGLLRTLEIAPHDKPLTARLSDIAGHENFSVKLSGTQAEITTKDNTTWLKLPPNKKTLHLNLLYTNQPNSKAPPATPLSPLLLGGSGISPESFEVTPVIGTEKKAWQVDQIPLPLADKKSPYLSKVRICDFDFFSDGDRALISTWDGDIWSISGLKDFKKITWKRYATGFFEPLGLRIIDDVPYIAARDAIWITKDLNQDGEADQFQIFNNDILITNNFHEFQFGLETDKDGNFYIAKGSPVRPGGRGFDKILPHNGTIIKISKDGKNLEVMATGLRASGGIAVGPNGELTSGENEGTWQPCCKLNYWEPHKGKAFFGVEETRHGVKNPFDKPLCYFPMNADNSGGSQLWIPEKANLGLKTGELLHLSYGQSCVYRVLRQKIGDALYQGGVVKLPLTLSSSAQRADIHPNDGSLYVSGFRGWQTNAAKEAGLQRIRRHPEQNILIPDSLQVTADGIHIRFETELDAELAQDPQSYKIQRWKYIRGPQYGSGHFSIDSPDPEAEASALEKESQAHRKEDTVKVTSAKLLPDKKTVALTLESLKPAEQMRIDYDLESSNADVMIGTIYHTIHEIPQN